VENHRSEKAVGPPEQNGELPEGDSVYKEARRLEPVLKGRTLPSLPTGPGPNG